jgi:hypothetical protein
VLTALRIRELSDVDRREWHLHGNSWKWEIPASRMKGKEAHVVPVTADIREIYDACPKKGRYLFSRNGGDKPMSICNSVTKHRIDAEILKVLHESQSSAVKTGTGGDGGHHGSIHRDSRQTTDHRLRPAQPTLQQICQQRKSDSRAGEVYLSVVENVRTDLIYAGLKLRDRERLFEGSGQDPGAWTIVLRTAPLRIHRHLRAVGRDEGRGKAGAVTNSSVARIKLRSRCWLAGLLKTFIGLIIGSVSLLLPEALPIMKGRSSVRTVIHFSLAPDRHQRSLLDANDASSRRRQVVAAPTCDQVARRSRPWMIGVIPCRRARPPISSKAGITPTTEDVCRGKEATTEVGTMKKIVSAIVLAVTMTAMPALAKNGLLENSSLGETVIYCDSTGALRAAMIIKVQSAAIVDLEVTGDDGGKVIARGVGWNGTRSDRPNTWWRRIRF